MLYVYLIQSEESGKYKIGVSKNPSNRLKQLQTGNGEKLVLINKYQSNLARKIEKALHNRYNVDKTVGEWFNLSLKEETNFVNECSKIENNFQYLIDNGNYFINNN